MLPEGGVAAGEETIFGGNLLKRAAMVVLITGVQVLGYPASPTVAQTPEPNQFELEYVGSAMWAARRDFVVSGNYVYCAMVNGLQVLDIQDPSTPRLLSQYFLNSTANCIDLKETTLYVAAGTALFMFDISHPGQPQVLGSLPLSFAVSDCEIQGDFAYFACQDGLRIADMAAPTHPIHVATLLLHTTPGSTSPSIEIRGDRAYFAGGDFWIIDISSPLVPAVLSYYKTTYCAGGVDVQDNLAVVADFSGRQPSSDSRLLFIDVSSDSASALLSRYNTYGDLYDVAIIDHSVYVAAGATGSAMFDIRDPASPQPIWCHAPLGQATRVIMSGDRAFVNNRKPEANFGDYDVDICKQADSTSIPWSFAPPADTGDFLILDVSIPNDVNLVGHYPHPGYSTGISVSGDLAYVTDETGQVTILDISAATEPEVLSHLELPGAPYETAVTGDLLVVADAYAGVQIVDVSDKSSPEIVGNVVTGYFAFGIAAVGNYAYIASGVGGLLIADISNPAAPNILSTYHTNDFAASVIVDGDFAYVADRYAGLEIIDIADPSAPRYVAQYPDPGEKAWTIYIAKQGNMIVASGGSIVRLLDVSNPEHPLLLGSLVYASSIIQSVAISGSYLILACAHEDLHIFEVRDPTAPSEVLFYSTPGLSSDVAVADDILWVADTYSLLGLRLPGATSVEEPPFEGNILPKSPELHQNFPNPFNPSTVIEYDLTRREPGAPPLAVGVDCSTCCQATPPDSR